ncbi:LysE/ArgO family amino acid transporter [Neorhizobium galegae]|uniref:LysE/ArgO family amino acid transporter n=1 Tax=Neorhizobium galegae TaxID=399 RepID=UPI000620F5D4|nr:LysE/ArgO family amino acid transporter [Neorhizobium galegae]CDZ30268.1 L-lysine exporter [Neorhizobium galegae bv. officinalis]MCQ1766751.1 LysE/ArgO family amino acid transporter [Neorhizobium galegae]MCQ1781322.1 LysE/ArgO family amino acid transporter [Neorhizobium galegae]MCQ1799976.1 LysE/ArgO family amino acid transporter [Neorhizobium galegae]MCQ1849446.1 LysE/ArgO family amino acid transporter [Neorhizobium galegae]
MDLTIYFTGMMMGLSLIVAIGAQNAFVLRQGLRNEYVFAVCLSCALSDAILIVLGVASLQQIVGVLPWLDPVMRYGGAAFLVWYGAKSLLSALRGSGALEVRDGTPASFAGTMAMCLALTWLNPHVYLDTVVLLGTVATRFPGHQFAFAAGATTGSFLFFFSLGYGSTRLGPVFSRPSSWRILEAGIACVMWLIAFELLSGI